jgi:hypothetical protein
MNNIILFNEILKSQGKRCYYCSNYINDITISSMIYINNIPYIVCNNCVEDLQDLINCQED